MAGQGLSKAFRPPWPDLQNVRPAFPSRRLSPPARTDGAAAFAYREFERIRAFCA